MDMRCGLPDTPRRLKYLEDNFGNFNKRKLEEEVLNYNKIAMDLFQQSSLNVSCQNC